MNRVSSQPSPNFMQPEEEEEEEGISSPLEIAGSFAISEEITSQSSSMAMVPYAVPVLIRVRTWPNLHSLFTLASLVSNVACLIFPSPTSILINVTIRCASIAFSLYSANKAKLSSDIVGIIAVSIIKNGSMIAIPADLIYEAINFYNCEISREFLKSKLACFFKKKERPPLDISRFVENKLKRDPTDPLDACKILSVPLDRIDDQEFIEERYNGRNREILLKNYKDLAARSSPFAPMIQREIDYRDTAYKTLKERNEANVNRNTI